MAPVFINSSAFGRTINCFFGACGTLTWTSYNKQVHNQEKRYAITRISAYPKIIARCATTNLRHSANLRYFCLQVSEADAIIEYTARVLYIHGTVPFKSKYHRPFEKSETNSILRVFLILFAR